MFEISSKSYLGNGFLLGLVKKQHLKGYSIALLFAGKDSFLEMLTSKWLRQSVLLWTNFF